MSCSRILIAVSVLLFSLLVCLPASARPIPDLVLTDANGQSVNLADSLGGWRPLVLVIDADASLTRQLLDGLWLSWDTVVIVVAQDWETVELLRASNASNSDATWLLGEAQQVFDAMDIPATPSLFGFENGWEVWRSVGLDSDEFFKERLEAWIGAGSAS